MESILILMLLMLLIAFGVLGQLLVENNKGNTANKLKIALERNKELKEILINQEQMISRLDKTIAIQQNTLNAKHNIIQKLNNR